MPKYKIKAFLSTICLGILLKVSENIINTFLTKCFAFYYCTMKIRKNLIPERSIFWCSRGQDGFLSNRTSEPKGDSIQRRASDFKQLPALIQSFFIKYIIGISFSLVYKINKTNKVLPLNFS